MSAGRRGDIAFLIGLALGLFAFVALGAFEYRESILHRSDFSEIWAGPHTLVEGSNPYDAGTWRQTVARMGTQVSGQAVYGYPPWVAFALAPLGALDLAAASDIWATGTLAIAAVATRALLRAFVPDLFMLHTLTGLTLTASQPAVTTLYSGQWSFVFVAASAAGILLLRRRRSVLAASALLPILAKPPLLLVHLWSLVYAAYRRGDRSFVIATIACFAAVPLVTWLARPEWLVSWLINVPLSRATQAKLTTLGHALVDVAGIWGALAAVAALGFAMFVAFRFDPRGDAWFAIWLALSPALAMYVHSYSLLVLLPAVVVAAGVASRRSPIRALALGWIGTAILLVGSSILFFGVAIYRQSDTFSGFLAPALFVLIAIGLWPQRQEVAAQPSPEVRVATPELERVPAS
jgi:hypothetical protein